MHLRHRLDILHRGIGGSTLYTARSGGLRDDVVRVLRPSAGRERARTAYDLYLRASQLDEDPLTMDEAEDLCRRVVATLAAEGNLAQTVVGIERGGSEMRARLGGEPVQSLSVLAARLPMLVVNPDSHHLLDAGPQYRRRFLDWGVFHVEPRYLAAWQRYRQVLRQRNAALRARQAAKAITAWDRELVETAERVHILRQAYVDRFGSVAQATVQRLLAAAQVGFQYLPGWPQKVPLAEALEAGLERDSSQGYTRYGPHRADLAIKWDDQPAAERVSRGQQKQLAIALLLGLIFALLRRSKTRIIAWPTAFVVEFLRDTPLLVQLYFLYFVLPLYGISLPAFLTGTLAVQLEAGLEPWRIKEPDEQERQHDHEEDHT